jgi:hypothetical protein
VKKPAIRPLAFILAAAGGKAKNHSALASGSTCPWPCANIQTDVAWEGRAVNLRFLAAVGLVVLRLPQPVRAEMPPQQRETSNLIVEGRVEALDEWWDLQTDHYRVWLRVDRVERGPAEVGELVPVVCFQRSRPWPAYPGAAGHSSMPELGDRIRAYVRSQGGRYEGNYPDWYDLLEPSPRGGLARLWGWRKFRAGCLAAGVLAAVLVVWRCWKRKRQRALHPPAAAHQL